MELWPERKRWYWSALNLQLKKKMMYHNGYDQKAANICSHSSKKKQSNSSSANISIVQFNARSLLPKMLELRYLASDLRPDIIAVTETWLSSSVPSTSMVTTPNFEPTEPTTAEEAGLSFLSVTD